MAQVTYAPGVPTEAAVVIQQPSALSSSPQQIFCPNCNRSVVTKIDHHNGTLTWLSCVLIFFLGGPFFCCLIPFCCSSCKDVDHKCPNCRRLLGTYKRL